MWRLSSVRHNVITKVHIKWREEGLSEKRKCDEGSRGQKDVRKGQAK